MPAVAQPKTERGLWVAADPLVQWSDVGEWTTLAKVLASDASGNTCIGDVQIQGATRGCILAADRGSSVKVAHLENFIVAVSNGRALIIPRSSAGQIKEFVAAAPDSVVTQGTEHLHIRLQGSELIVEAKA
jgi:hypothetical protein